MAAMEHIELVLETRRAIRWVVKIANFLRKHNCGGIVRDFRYRAAIGMLTSFHGPFAHALRDLSLCDDWTNPDVIGPAMTRVCNGCQDVTAGMLDIDRHNAWTVHCTIKVLSVTDEGPGVATIGRSSYHGEGRSEIGFDKLHPVCNNSGFAAMLGDYDGRKRWEYRRAFSCNDLPSKGSDYQCTRENYSDYYKSTLSLPIRYKVVGQEDPITLGFLTFDRNEVNGFPGLPDVYEEEAYPYNVKVAGSALWQAGAAMADLMAMVLRFMPKE